MAVTRRQLSKLKRIARQCYLSDALNPEECAHKHYPSAQSFVNHLIWTLDQNSGTAQTHQEVIQDLFLTHCLCGFCRNMMLCRMPLHVLFSNPAIINYRILNPSRCFTFYSLQLRMCNHPKFFKAMIKTAPSSMKVFRAICVSLESILKIMSGNEETETAERYRGNANAYTTILFLSFKYWNKEHIIYFVENHSGYLSKWINRMAKLETFYNNLPRDHTESEVWMLDGIRMIHAQIYMMIRGIGSNLKSIVSKVDFSKLRNVDGMLKGNIYPEYCEMVSRKEIKMGLRKNIHCSSLSCHNPERESEFRFKLCGGCKTTYYCSRSCQKRAWVQHKSYCKVLAQRFSL